MNTTKLTRAGVAAVEQAENGAHAVRQKSALAEANKLFHPWMFTFSGGLAEKGTSLDVLAEAVKSLKAAGWRVMAPRDTNA